MAKVTDNQLEETQAALRASIERAQELVCEAKQMMRPHPVEDEPKPADPAS